MERFTSQCTRLAICSRAGYPLNELYLSSLGDEARIVFLDDVVVGDMAASLIKRRLEAGENPRDLFEEGLLPLSVAKYIEEMKLYRRTHRAC
jgi:nicotinic acid mononucleotide adenylyltransferase